MTRMTRAAIAPCGGDPFVALLFLHNFKTVWQDEVDKLYVHYDAQRDEPTRRYIEKRFKEHPKVAYLDDNFINLTTAMRACFEACKEDLIMLTEDDGYITEKGILEPYFNMLERNETDMVGSPRGSASSGFLQACKRKGWGPEPFFDPCFFFMKKEHLIKTDLIFGDVHFKKGQYVKELDWTTENDDECVDTLGWINVQLRNMNLRFHCLPLCKIFPQYEKIEDMPPLGFVHAGSLSSGWRGEYIRGRFFSVGTDYGLGRDYDKRVAFWLIAANLEEYNEVADLKKKYLEGIEKLISISGLNRERIQRLINSFKVIFQ